LHEANKGTVRKHNVTANLSVQKLLHTTDAIWQATQDNWKGFCQYMESPENNSGKWMAFYEL
jgi:hypothetical protein